MIGETNQDAGGNAETRNLATAANAAASEQTRRVEDEAPPPRLSRAAAKPVPKTQRLADARALEAHAERRQRLAAQVRVENPSRTEEEIEERLAQFGV
jgi:hypothetical protein